MNLTVKQTQAIDILESKAPSELLYGGAAGGGKSALGCYWLLKSALRYPGTRWLMGRTKLKDLKETTLNTFWEICQRKGVRPKEHYRYNSITGNIRFFNGSEIVLKDLFYYPSDPEFTSLGGAEYTGAFMDEGNQASVKARNIVKSRIRYKLKEYDLQPKLLITCNPYKNWVYTDFYKPHKEGTLPENRHFIQALLSDNPYITDTYRQTLMGLDKTSRERLLFGNWEYDDDPASLIQYDAIADLFTNEHVLPGERCITADIALHGSDRFVLCVWSGFRLIKLIVSEKLDGAECEQLIRKAATEYAVPQSRIVYDADGLGGYLKGYLRNAKAFHNGAAPVEVAGEKERYKNLKSQCYFKMASRISKAGYYIADTAEPYRELITQELEYVRNASYGTDRPLAVLPKETIREMIGRSPDFADAIAMREYLELVSAGDFAKYF